MKTKRTILSVLMTLVMVASLCAVAAAPAGAGSSDDAGPVELESSDPGTAEWSTDYVYSGKYSAELYAEPDGGLGRVVMPLEMAFEDLANFSFYVNADSAQDLPMHEIELKEITGEISVIDGTDVGNAPDTIYPDTASRISIVSQPRGLDAWSDLTDLETDSDASNWQQFGTHKDADISPDEGHQWVVFWKTDNGWKSRGYFTWSKIHDLFDMNATIQDVRVENIHPTNNSSSGGTANSTVYVDDIVINDATYTLPRGRDDNDDGVALYPNKGTVGTLETITLTNARTGFPEEQPLVVKYDGTEVDTAPPEPKTKAEYTIVSFKVPESTQGTHTVKVVVGLQDATENFTVEPSVSISPASGATGSMATAKCRGFASGYSIDVTAGTDDTVVGSGTTDSNGSADVNCTMDAKGTIDAEDGAGNSAPTYNTATFDFAPGITLDPASGPAKTDVTVSGSDFTEGEGDYSVRYRIAGDTWTEFVGESLVDNLNDDGEFEGTFTPSADLSIGSKKVEAGVDFDADWSDAPDETASATFTVESSEISLDPAEGPVGETVVVESSNLPAGKKYKLKFGGDTVAEGETTAEGALTNSFEVPEDTAKYDVAVVIDGETVAEATYSVIGASLTVSPEEGAVGDSIAVTAEGFPASSSFNIVFCDSATKTKTPLAYLTSTSLGGFSTTVTIPQATKGHAVIRAVKADETWDNTTVKAELTVTGAAAAVSVDDGLASVWSEVDESMWYFDNSDKSWSQYYKANPDAVPSESKLTNLESGKVYWAHVTEDTTLKYGGRIIDLTAGWNVISWP